MPLSRRMPELATLELLRAVARTGSIGAAAREQGVTQQAVSLRLRGLELQVGVTLLNRDRRGSQLTAAGVLLVEWAGGLLDAAASVDQALATLRDGRDAHLEVAASMTVAEHLLPTWLFQLRSRQQRLGRAVTSVRLTATNSASVLGLVASGAAGLGFVEGPEARTGLRSKVVATDELVVVVAPTHPWARRRRPVSPDELAAASLVVREPGSGTRSALEAALTAAVALVELPTPTLELSTNTAVRMAVIAGSGAAVLSSLTVQDDLLTGRLVRVPTIGLLLARRLRAIWRGPPVPPLGPLRDLVALATDPR